MQARFLYKEFHEIIKKWEESTGPTKQHAIYKI